MRVSRVVFATASVLAAGAAAVGVATRSKAGPVSHRSAIARRLKVARLGTKAGGTYAVHRARRVFANAARKEELDTRFEIKTAEEVAATLGDMKGLMMKVGQMA